MQRSKSTARLAALVAFATGAALTLGTADVRAQACYPGDETPVCIDYDEPDPGSTAIPGIDSGDELEVPATRSVGADDGNRAARAVVFGPEFPGPALTPPEPGSVIQDLGRGIDLSFYFQKTADEQVYGTGAAVKTLCDTGFCKWPHVTTIAGERIPVSTGSARTPTESDNPEQSGGTDPVNPATGEMIVREIDLAFPGFGVPFEHTRVYRSRVAYDGALGYGWDHSYNRRLFSTEDDDCGEQIAYLTGDGWAMYLHRDAVAELLLDGGTVTRITYRAPVGTLLELVGYHWETSDGSVSLRWWTMTTPDGTMAKFDGDGLLTRLEDANAYGLTIGWEPSARPADDGFRVAYVVDSAGRTIEYRYDPAGMLTAVVEPDSGLQASYEHDGNGDLVSATSATGRTESYEYSSGHPDELGDYVPEGYLRDACELSCAPTGSECGAGGGCDDASQRGQGACQTACLQAANECEPACVELCSEGAGGAWCDAACDDACGDVCATETDYEAECAQFFDDHVRGYCDDCHERIRSMCHRPCATAVFCLGTFQYSSAVEDANGCDFDCQYALYTAACLVEGGLGQAAEDVYNFLLTAGALVGSGFDCLAHYGCALFGIDCASCDMEAVESQWTAACNDSCTDCLAYGNLDECAANEQNCLEPWADCADECRDGFMGHPTSCDPAGARTGCPDRLRAECPGHCASACAEPCNDACNDACLEGCGDQIYDCFDECDDYSDEDWYARCEPACVDACIAKERDNGPYRGPKYGYPRDLNHNLVRIYDGNGDLYVENVYGGDMWKPSFDAVVRQQFGRRTIELHYRDLAGEASRPPDWTDPFDLPAHGGLGSRVWDADPVAAQYTQSLADYRGVDVCPGPCVAPPPSVPDQIYVPMSFGLAVVEPRGALAAGGLPVTRAPATAGPVPLTVLRLTSPGPYVSQFRTATGGEDVVLPDAFEVEVGGVAVHFTRASYDGSYYMSGFGVDPAELDPLIVATDRTGAFRVYPGELRALHAVGDGRCHAPFVAARAGADGIALVPAGACDAELVVSPLASVTFDAAVVGELRANGEALAYTDMFAPTLLVPGRHTVALRAVDPAEGTYALEAGARSGSAPAWLARAVTEAAASAPVLQGPRAGSTSAAPAVVYHVPGALREHVDLSALGEPRMPVGPPGGSFVDGGNIWIEAESGAASGVFTVGLDPGAAGGRYVWAPQGTGGGAGALALDVDVPVAGTYVLYGRVSAPTSGDDSLFVQVDDGPQWLWDTARSPAGQWSWDAVAHRGGADPISVYLSAGHHTLTVSHREDGTRLDRMLLTRSGTRPDGLGDTAPGGGQATTFAPAAGVVALDVPDGFKLPPEPTCVNGVYDQPRQGTGPGFPKPARATVVIDAYGFVHTYYYDRNRSTLREVDHDAGAARDFDYDEERRLTGRQEPLGDRVCAAYDELGNVVTLTDFGTAGAVGGRLTRTRRFAYTPRPTRLATVYDPALPGRVQMSYGWDARGNLTRATTATGEVTVYEPAPWGDPATVTEPDGTRTTYAYDVASATVRQTTVEPAGSVPEVTTVDHDRAGRPVRAQYPDGRSATWTWTDGALTAYVEAADGIARAESYAYDGDGQLVHVEAGPATTELSYAPTGGLRRARRAGADGTEATECADVGPGGRVLERVLPDGTRQRFVRNSRGDVIRVEAGAIARAGGWDDDCPALSPYVGWQAHVLAQAGYDLNGRVSYAVDAASELTEVRYDSLGRVAMIETPDGATTRMGYDARDRVVWRARYDATGAGVPYRAPVAGDPGLVAGERLAYDGDGRVVQRRAIHVTATGATVGDGFATTAFAYDAAAGTVEITDDRNKKTVLSYDGLGRLTGVALPTGDFISRAYAAGDRVVSTMRSAPVTGGVIATTRRFNGFGLPVAEQLTSTGGAPLILRSWSYDARGRLAHAGDSDGSATVYSHDDLDRVVGYARSAGGATEQVALVLNERGRVIARDSDDGSGAGSLASSYEYDSLGRLVYRLLPEGVFEEMTYYRATPWVSTRTDARLVTASYEYTALGLPATVTAGGVERSYEYDALGRVVLARVDGDGGAPIETELAWDSLGNRTREAVVGWPDAAIVHVHDGTGNATSSTLAGYAVARTYDPIGRIKTLAIAGDTTRWNYGGLGGPTLRRRHSGLDTRMVYDALGRRNAQYDRVGSTVHAVRRWEMPLADGTPRIELTRFGGAPLLASVFEIGAGGRVAAESHGIAGIAGQKIAPLTAPDAATAAVAGFTTRGDWRRYAVDPRGNWLGRTAADSALDAVIALTGLDGYASFGAEPFGHDARGAVTLAGDLTFEYDAFGDLVRVAGPGVERHYRYDALGRVAEMRDEAGAVERYAYDGLHRVVRERDGAIDVTVYGDEIDELLLTLGDDGGRHYYHQDRLGSVYAVSGADGSWLETYAYTAYGERSIYDASGGALADSAVDNRFGFQGHLHDAATDLVNMRARWYAPAYGRFTSPDPIGFAGGPSLYAFLDSAPLSGTDRLGLAKDRDQPWEPVVPSGRKRNATTTAPPRASYIPRLTHGGWLASSAEPGGKPGKARVSSQLWVAGNEHTNVKVGVSCKSLTECNIGATASAYDPGWIGPSTWFAGAQLTLRAPSSTAKVGVEDGGFMAEVGVSAVSAGVRAHLGPVAAQAEVSAGMAAGVGGKDGKLILKIGPFVVGVGINLPFFSRLFSKDTSSYDADSAVGMF